MEELKLYVHRRALKERYTIGTLYVDGKKFCDTLEDTDRGLQQSDSLARIAQIKVYGETAIPTGKYSVGWQRWTKYRVDVPNLKNVPGFIGILIHNGATERNTEGCILVGENKVVGHLQNGKKYMTQLTNIVKKAIRDGRAVTIEIGYDKPTK